MVYYVIKRGSGVRYHARLITSRSAVQICPPQPNFPQRKFEFEIKFSAGIKKFGGIALEQGISLRTKLQSQHSSGG